MKNMFAYNPDRFRQAVRFYTDTRASLHDIG